MPRRACAALRPSLSGSVVAKPHLRVTTCLPNEARRALSQLGCSMTGYGGADLDKCRRVLQGTQYLCMRDVSALEAPIAALPLSLMMPRRDA